LFITGFRLSWHQFLEVFDVSEQPSLTNGILDLRGQEWSSYKTYRLDGEWEFYPESLVINGNNEKKQFITVPSDWKYAFQQDDEREKSVTYGTYKLKILLDDKEQNFSIRINRIENASAIYANDKLITRMGNPSSNVTDYVPKQLPTTIKVPVKNGQIDLAIEVANHAETGGIVKTIRFGTVEAIDKRVLLSIGLQLLLIVVFLIHSMYTMGLYFTGKRFKGLLYFSLIMICGVISIMTDDDKLLFIMFDISYQWSIKIMILSYIIGLILITLLINYLFPNHLSKKIERLFLICVCVVLVFILATPIQIIISIKGLFYVLAIAFISIPAYILRKVIKEKTDVTYLLFGILIVLNNLIWSIGLSSYSSEFMHYPFDLIFASFVFTAFWFQQFFKAMGNVEKLALELQEEDKRKDAFLINTSHELRNPLHGMMNITQMMLGDKEASLSLEQKKQLELHLNINKRLSLLVEDLLDITRLKEQRIVLKWEAISLLSIVTGVMDMVKLSIGEKNVTMRKTIPADFPLLWGDEQRLVQIIFNLLHNAVKFTEEGSITVSARVENSWAIINVEDTGIGINEKELATIFKPYKQGKKQNDNLVEGLGLGLTVCKRLVKLHGGTIDVESTLGEGTTFSLTFPLAKEAERVSPARIVEEEIVGTKVSSHVSTIEHFVEKDIKPKATASILLVDDDYTNLLIIQQVLEAEQYRVTTAMDAKKALAILKSNPVDLVISDVMMPMISGYELTRQIRKRYSLAQLPVLLLTARTQSEDLLTGFTAGANDYIKKPVDALELKARVQGLINLKQALKEHTQMEGAWLQSQIQPHFLFNTLNTIASLGISDVPKMQRLLEEFSTYLRYSFDFKNAEPVIRLSNELAIVRSYVYIEQQRFGERLQVDWAVDPKIDIFIPPLSIQPLVENAIKHGLLRKENGGTVRIEVKQESNHYQIIISDDGIGITDEEMATLFKLSDEDNKKKTTRVGLRNINKRLRQLYDTKITVKSVPEKGTTVSFNIPKQLAYQEL